MAEINTAIQASVLFEERGTTCGRRIGIARLNTEKSLNALSLDMIRTLDPQLRLWAKDDGIALVIIHGGGEKAFCSGADVRGLYNAIKAHQGSPNNPEALAFFGEEYRLDFLLHTFPKPVLVWGSGIVMGGGLGILAGGSHRVVTETSRLAMPEIAIGLFPDAGGSWFLRRMPGDSGLFVALTGVALNGHDATASGLADHFLLSADREALFRHLTDIDWTTTDTAGVLTKALRTFASRATQARPSSNLVKHERSIATLTKGDDPQDIVNRITSYDGDSVWLAQAATTLASGSPTTAALIWELRKRAATLSLADVFRLEMIVAIQCCAHPDFSEGVRALLVEKDNAPKWTPKTLAAVTPEWIESHFTAPWEGAHPLADLSTAHNGQRVAFIGLGNMGQPMARNLAFAGYELSVFDIFSSAVEALSAVGAKPAASAAAAAASAEIIITMLPASQNVRRLYLEEGLLEAAAPGTLIIDCSTISPQTAREVAAAAAAKGCPMIDAPVSGGTAGAAGGTLTFIVGGDKAALDRARPVLEKMGQNIFHAGQIGAGQIAKICNNMLLGILMIGTSEAINLGVANGVDPKALSEIMSESSGSNWVLERYNPWPGVMEQSPASSGWRGGFGSDLMLKDLGLAQEAALAAGAFTPLGSLARQLYQLHHQAGHGAMDFSSIASLISKQMLVS